MCRRVLLLCLRHILLFFIPSIRSGYVSLLSYPLLSLCFPFCLFGFGFLFFLLPVLLFSSFPIHFHPSHGILGLRWSFWVVFRWFAEVRQPLMAAHDICCAGIAKKTRRVVATCLDACQSWWNARQVMRHAAYRLTLRGCSGDWSVGARLMHGRPSLHAWVERTGGRRTILKGNMWRKATICEPRLSRNG